jgi:hypothetical protein
MKRLFYLVLGSILGSLLMPRVLEWVVLRKPYRCDAGRSG